MRVFYSSKQAQKFLKKGAAVTMGNYDGLHLGHRSIIKTLKKEAKKRKLKSVVYTFEPHPVRVLAPKITPPLINTLDQKIELFKELGIDILIFEKFDRQFGNHSPKSFFDKFLMKRLNAHFIVVGHDFSFGNKRQGNIETLETFSKAQDIDCQIIDPCLEKDILASSSLVRKYVQGGELQEASLLLRRLFFIDGIIIKGDQRGKDLGFPTANLNTKNELIPLSGVYATKIKSPYFRKLVA